MTLFGGFGRHGLAGGACIYLAFFVILSLYYGTLHIEDRLKQLAAIARRVHEFQLEQKIAAVEQSRWREQRSRDGSQNSEHYPQEATHASSWTSLTNSSVPGNVSVYETSEKPDAVGVGGAADLGETFPLQEYDCRSLTGADDVLLIIKTGATEIFSKLPTHLITTTTCVPDFLVFSDMEQQISDLVIHDALADISDRWKTSDGTMSMLYPKIKYYYSKGLDITELAKQGAWELDKWKNIPMAVKAWALYPAKKWFMFIDADSAILWSNLLLWTSQLDHAKPLYFGSPTYVESTTFAHGGSGYLASAASMKLIHDKFAERKDEWEQRTSQVCCGDLMFAEALLAADEPVHVQNAGPMIQGLTPQSIDYDDWHWCKGPVTFHHVTTAEVEELWRWEQELVRQRGRHAPILYADMFYHFSGQHFLTSPLLSPGSSFSTTSAFTVPEANRTNWDNLSGGAEFKLPSSPDLESLSSSEESNSTNPYSSADDCARRCESEESCMQWKWKPGYCRLGDRPNLGRRPFTYWSPNEEDKKGEMVSGWFEDRVRKYVERLGECDLSKAFEF